MDKRVTGKVVEGKSRERTKKGILGSIETSCEQKGKGKEAAERTHDEIQKGESENVEPYVFQKYGVFFSEGDGVEEKERLSPVSRAYRSGGNE